MPALGKADLFPQSADANANLFSSETPSQTHPERALDQPSEHPLVLPGLPMKLTITGVGELKERLNQNQRTE